MPVLRIGCRLEDGTVNVQAEVKRLYRFGTYATRVLVSCLGFPVFLLFGLCLLYVSVIEISKHAFIA